MLRHAGNRQRESKLLADTLFRRVDGARISRHVRGIRAMMTRLMKAIAAAAMMSAAVPAAQAADAVPVVENSDWQFTAALYLWGAGLDGKVGVFGLRPANIDLGFSDILENLQFAFMGMGEARNGRFMLGMDATYSAVSMDVKTPLGILANKIGIDSTALMLTGVGGYAVVDGDVARLDLIAGGRLWSVNNEFDVKGGLFGGLSKSDGAVWADPLVGAKLRLDLAPDIYATGWGMVGGFGVGSDLMWDLMGGAGYQFTDNFSVFAGYRAVSVDYSNDGFVYDVVQKGPILAGVFQF